MAGAGVGFGQLDYPSLCGLYYLRRSVAEARRADMAESISIALANLGGGG